ncbi:MAG: hypothetical protein CSB55_06820 [Candidatus Cloacimonadota bacterium]|nr:MAG: hypothetical protein CSB55_06820 [Candidatus Cloacimonadota bacterium]
MKSSVKIRAIKENDLETIYNWNSPDSRGCFQEFTFESFKRLESEYQENGFIADKFKILIFEDDKNPLGLIYISVLRPGIFRLGLVVCEESYREKGIGTKVCGMITEHLFANYPCVRIEADTDIDNIPAQKVLEKSGFEKEGVLRKYRFHGGKWRDSLIYGIIRNI